MSLFNRQDKENVPTIEVQGEQATIPQPGDRDDGETNQPEKKQVKFPKKIWG